MSLITVTTPLSLFHPLIVPESGGTVLFRDIVNRDRLSEYSAFRKMALRCIQLAKPLGESSVLFFNFILFLFISIYYLSLFINVYYFFDRVLAT